MSRAAGYTYLLLALGFLYGPIAIMILLAFNRSPLYQLPFQFDPRWFVQLSTDARLIQASINSVALATANALLATAIGLPAALALGRRQFRARGLLYALLLPPITIPWLIIATAMLLFFFWTGIGRGFPAMLVGHVAVSLPYVVLVLIARLHNQDLTVEEAATILGASQFTVFRRVTLPLLLPGVVAALLFAFTVSFDNFVISYFLAPPGISTLPVEIYSAIRAGFTPEVNAVSAIIFGLSMGVLVLASRFTQFV
jgi:spermidine/putrescine transport system permease protein